MKKVLLSAALILAVSTASASMNMNHNKNHDHGRKKTQNYEDMEMPEGMIMKIMNIDGFKVIFHVMDKVAFHSFMESMGHAGHKMEKGATNHIMMEIIDPDGEKVENAAVKVKVIDPEKKAETKPLHAMMGHYGANFKMHPKGKYQIMTLFKVKGKKHKGGYWYKK